MEDEDKRYKQAQERVRRIRSFWSSVFTYIWVNILLLVINLFTNPHRLWFFWVTIIWGIVLIIQAVNIFTIRDRFLGENWEQRKIRELMDKDREKNQPPK